MFKYFKIEEFNCKCCGKNEMDLDFVKSLNELRGLCGFSLSISSGYRCPEHNSRVSNTGLLGPHTTGHAGDLKVEKARALTVLAKAMEMGKFTGFGINQKGTGRFIHLDNLPNTALSPRPTIWTY